MREGQFLPDGNDVPRCAFLKPAQMQAAVQVGRAKGFFKQHHRMHHVSEADISHAHQKMERLVFQGIDCSIPIGMSSV